MFWSFTANINLLYTLPLDFVLFLSKTVSDVAWICGVHASFIAKIIKNQKQANHCHSEASFFGFLCQEYNVLLSLNLNWMTERKKHPYLIVFAHQWVVINDRSVWNTPCVMNSVWNDFFIWTYCSPYAFWWIENDLISFYTDLGY